MPRSPDCLSVLPARLAVSCCLSAHVIALFSNYGHSGGGANMLCMVSDPTYDQGNIDASNNEGSYLFRVVRCARCLLGGVAPPWASCDSMLCRNTRAGVRSGLSSGCRTGTSRALYVLRAQASRTR